VKDAKNIVIEILKTVVSCNQKKNITLNSDLREDLGMDSMRLISLAMQLEQKAGIDLVIASENYDFTMISKVSDIVKIVEKLTLSKTS
jgi:acyl carrier protein